MDGADSLLRAREARYRARCAHRRGNIAHARRAVRHGRIAYVYSLWVLLRGFMSFVDDDAAAAAADGRSIFGTMLYSDVAAKRDGLGHPERFVSHSFLIMHLTQCKIVLFWCQPSLSPSIGMATVTWMW